MNLISKADICSLSGFVFTFRRFLYGSVIKINHDAGQTYMIGFLSKRQDLSLYPCQSRIFPWKKVH